MWATPDQFLLDFHRVNPGITSRAFARGLDAAGRSSYELLADQVPPGATVLDLGCGDGFLLERLHGRGFPAADLLGIDMSAEELALARQRPDLAGVLLVRGRAQALPLPERAVACVVSHLAFTLMSDVEQVVAELARVLAPGGVFLSVVGGGPRLGDTFELFLDVFQDIYRRQPVRVPRLGDVRARTPAGLRTLFGEHSGFVPEPELHDITIRLDGTFEQIWASLCSIYELHFVAEPERQLLRQELERRTAPCMRADGQLPCSMAVGLVRCRRA